LRELGVEVVSFDFFVNWNTREVAREVWVKRTAVRNSNSPLKGRSVEDVRDALSHWDDEMVTLDLFAVKNDFCQAWVIIPDWWEWDKEQGNVLHARLAHGRVADVELRSYATLCSEIHRMTGVYFTPGKGLTYSTTALEAALAQTRTPWPGDVDCVVIDPLDGRAIAVLEFKKHTLSSPISASFSNYYPGRDSRRWDRLAILAERLDAPLMCLYYSVNPEEETAILQWLEGGPGLLTPGKQIRTRVPLIGDEVGQRDFLQSFVSALRPD
jgi:hypothetical protein